MQTVTINTTPNLDKLKMLINKRAGYSKAVKMQVIKQFDGITTDISDDEYWTVSGNIEECLQANKTVLDRCKVIKKLVYRLETHKYAPELNKVLFMDGGHQTVRGITTIEGAVKYLAIHHWKLFI